MWLSDVSVKRPVLATVINALLVVSGAFALLNISVREYPDIDPPIVSVSTNYPGASAAVVETRITQVLEDALSGIEGVETIESASSNGEGSISIEFSLARDIEAAANDVRDAVSRVIDRLPDEADPPEIEKAESDSEVIMWLNMSSTRMDTLELTDYAERYVVDRMSSLDGVEIDGLGKPRADAGDALEPGEFAVRDGDALAEPGRAEPLALQQRVEDVALLQACEPRRARRQLLEKLLLVLDLERSNHRLGADEIS